MVNNQFPYNSSQPAWMQNLLSAYNVYFVQSRTRGEEYLISTFLSQFAPEVTLLSDDGVVWAIVDEDKHTDVVERWERLTTIGEGD